MSNTILNAPAQLRVGGHDTLVHAITNELQAVLCPNNHCATCVTCRQISEQRHHNIIWLMPERAYTIEQLDVIFERTIMQLQSDEKCFFIIQHADRLSSACSNKLLKPIEEPAPGYHFIFLTEHKELVLPTIRSRCHVQEMAGGSSYVAESKIISHFTALKAASPVEFMKDLDKERPNDQQTLMLIRQLYQHWQEFYAHTQKKNSQHDRYALSMLKAFERALQNPPAPGSSILFWRNLYLQLFN